MQEKPNNFLIGTIVVVVLLVGGFFAATRMGVLGNVNTTKSHFNDGAYHAVFLSNNQVYFGKIQNASGDYVKLSNIYYLILKRPLQQQTAEGTQEEGSKPKYTVVKLGNELHGPKDEMSINRDQILFIEELRDDSKVVQAITQFKEQQTEGADTESSSAEGEEITTE